MAGKRTVEKGGMITSGWSGGQDAFLESMSEAGKSVVEKVVSIDD